MESKTDTQIQNNRSYNADVHFRPNVIGQFISRSEYQIR
mgnify:CR=1 FL=1